MKEVRFGLIGMGAVSYRHADSIVEIENARLVAVCDTDEQVAKEAGEKYHVDSYTNSKEMLERDDIDAVVIMSPDYAHKDDVVAAFEAGKHVLCEKPMAIEIEDCKAMMQAWKKTDRKFMIGQVCRKTPGFILAKQMIEAGEIGEVSFVESEYAHDYTDRTLGHNQWRISKEHLRYPIIGGACHAIDLIRWLAGENPSHVAGFSTRKARPEWPYDDTTIGIMNFPSGTIGKVFCSQASKRPYTMRTVIYGTEGTIVTSNTEPLVTLYKLELDGTDKFHGGEVWKDIGIQIPVDINNHNMKAEIEEFVDAIINDKEVETTGFEGAATVAVGRAIVEACEKKQVIPVSYEF